MPREMKIAQLYAVLYPHMMSTRCGCKAHVPIRRAFCHKRKRIERIQRQLKSAKWYFPCPYNLHHCSFLAIALSTEAWPSVPSSSNQRPSTLAPLQPWAGPCPGAWPASVRQVLGEALHARLVLDILGRLLVQLAPWLAHVAPLVPIAPPPCIARLAAVSLALGAIVQLVVLPLVLRVTAEALAKVPQAALWGNRGSQI